MVKILDVYLHRDLVGHLTQDAQGDMEFSYTENWLQNAVASPLSHSLPLRKEPFLKKECNGFFSGILPEEENRRLIARNLGISPRNDFAMLEQIGGECAGAVTFLPKGEPLPEPAPHYRELSTNELLSILRELPKRPLMAGDQGVRLSLAGAQNKIAVKVSGGRIYLPIKGAPSTHILKPTYERFRHLVDNELFCLNLANRLGISAVRAEKRKIEDMEFLFVERYDRKEYSKGQAASVIRIHQEDFCQALNVVSEMKYQKEGGPSLKQCFDLLRNVSDMPVMDLPRLLDAVIFNYLIGNNDAHGKNFSLLYDNIEASMGTNIRLAPLYDLICTTYYPELDEKMAMKIGGESTFKKIRLRHFEKFAEDVQLARPLVKKRVLELVHQLLMQLSVMGDFDELKVFLQERCRQAIRNLNS